MLWDFRCVPCKCVRFVAFDLFSEAQHGVAELWCATLELEEGTDEEGRMETGKVFHAGDQ